MKVMKPASFDSTPAFRHFHAVMKKLIAVPKAELDQMVKASADLSPRKGDPNAPGRKSTKRTKRDKLNS